MKLTACLLSLAVSLGAVSIALAQQASFPPMAHAPGGRLDNPIDPVKNERAAAPKAAATAPALIEILGADMAPQCKDADVDRARKLAAVCNDKKQCRFVPEEAAAEAEACARESLVLWNCGDGKTRETPLAGKPGESRAITLECPQPAPVVASAAPPQPAPADRTETVHSQEQKIPVPKRVIQPQGNSITTEAGIVREEVRMACEAFTDPRAPENPGGRMAQIHASLWARPDHTANGTANQCGPKTDVPESALPVP